MRLVVMLALSAISGFALGQGSDEAALALADRTKAEPASYRPCVTYAELAADETTYSDGNPVTYGGRASFNLRCEGAFAGGWRGVFSDRFDQFWAQGSAAQGVNTLKEAYLSFRPSPAILIDAGRINVREGVGFAYNPTDYFSAGATRAVISIDPETLRDERMGALMGRFQTLWASGSLTGIFAPRVGAKPNDSTFNPDWGATNARQRWLLVWSQRLAQEFQPQISLTGAEHESPRIGVNLTHLLNSATVGYLEWSGGRYGNTEFRSQLSTGATYTTPYKLSLTLEYEYNGAAVGTRGEVTTRHNVFAYAHWDDLGIDRLGLTAFVRFDPYDHSRVTWMEARYHWNHAGVAIQWQRNSGGAASELTLRPLRQSWLALIDYYF